MTVLESACFFKYFFLLKYFKAVRKKLIFEVFFFFRLKQMTIIKVITLTINYNITGDKVRYHKNSQKNNKNKISKQDNTNNY